MYDDIYFIWSIEHNAWWKPNSNGYTDSFSKAGQYTKDEAYKIAARANWSTLNEVPVPANFFDFQCLLHKSIREMKV